MALASLRSVFERRIVVSTTASGSKLRSATFDRDALRLDSIATKTAISAPREAREPRFSNRSLELTLFDSVC